MRMYGVVHVHLYAAMRMKCTEIGDFREACAVRNPRFIGVCGIHIIRSIKAFLYHCHMEHPLCQIYRFLRLFGNS